MQYQPFGTSGQQVSRLGFGMMRLPTHDLGDGNHPIDREEATRMLRHAIDHGVNYVDTAYGYHGGESEVVTGLALKNGYRERVMLTTKLPHWLVEKHADMDKLLDEQLTKLGVPYVDNYLMHALNGESYDRLKRFNFQAFIKRAKADGRIRHAGFSFHDDKQAFLRILKDYDWDLAQVQFNYLDDENQATLDGIKEAGKLGIPIVVMEPLRGGSLANPPEDIEALVNHHKNGWSAVEWAFRYTGDYPQVVTILSGMSTMEQVQDNLRIFENVKAGGLAASDHDFIKRLKQGYLARIKVGCTACNYCQPCPQGVQIPRIFEAYNEAHMLNNPGSLTWRYGNIIKDQGDGSLCVECGQCEAVCPQQLPIMADLKTIDAEARA